MSARSYFLSVPLLAHYIGVTLLCLGFGFDNYVVWASGMLVELGILGVAVSVAIADYQGA